MEKILTERRSQENLTRTSDHRSPFERDLARLIHSAGFRRLQSKTQVLGIGEGDFHRTRLTHSMEVAQISRGIVRNLSHRFNNKTDILKYMPDDDLIFCIGLAHDIGHPPFGHGGEIALNYSMIKNSNENTGFEGNGQTLRLLAKEESHTEGFGLDLTRRTLLGVLKYPANYNALCKTKWPKCNDIISLKADDWKPPKCFHSEEDDVVNWLLMAFSKKDRVKFSKYSEPTAKKHGKTEYKSLDTSIMELADDIAYGVHDLEDGIALKLINRDQWAEVLEKIKKIDSTWLRTFKLSKSIENLFGSSSDRKKEIGALVHAFIVSAKFRELDFESPILKFNVVLEENSRQILKLLKDIVFTQIIDIPEARTIEYQGQQIVGRLFQAISSNPKSYLKSSFKEKWEQASSKGKNRVICDYISGMTDEYATRLYERMFLPRQGTIFKRL